MPRILDRYPENIRADFRNCSAKSLKSYISRYSLNAREDASVPEMASIVAKHFDQGMDAREEDIIPNFVNFILNYNGGNVESKGSKSRIERNRRGTRATAVVNNEMPSSEAEADDNSSGKKEDKKKDVENEVQEKEPKVYCFCQRKSFGDMIACDGAKCEIEWFHVGCVGINIDQLKGGKWYCSNCASKKKKGKHSKKHKEDKQDNLEEENASKSSRTYQRMISDALQKLPGNQGTFRGICEHIESVHGSTLNWKSESDLRKTPIWKSSVRKILFSNSRFKRLDEEGNLYGFK